jgi:hypothetical protein
MPEQPLAVVRNYNDLIAAVLARKQNLGITFEVLDAVSGLQEGYSCKLLGPGRKKKLGPLSFDCILAALGMKLVAVEDEEALARVRNRLTPRKHRPRSPPTPQGPAAPALADQGPVVAA